LSELRPRISSQQLEQITALRLFNPLQSDAEAGMLAGTRRDPRTIDAAPDEGLHNCRRM
jgi:hypothetical protein